MIDSFLTIQAPATGEFKDRGSKFFAYAYPARNEEEALAWLAQLRKEHFKARHHCFAWRFGIDGLRFRANDDGEPSGTAGRPILSQIDSAGLTDIVVIVVRYFGGVLLGASGLIHAYREAAAEAIRQSVFVEKIIKDHFQLQFDYALMPDIMQGLKKLDVEILHQTYADNGLLEIAIRKSDTEQHLLKLKASLWKVSPEEAQTLDWPPGLQMEHIS
ncbi:MAG: YigZ family protein [Saprospiraceae bacterium]|nr:YigZ family protein [Saprospiraceae bacterium]